MAEPKFIYKFHKFIPYRLNFWVYEENIIYFLFKMSESNFKIGIKRLDNNRFIIFISSVKYLMKSGEYIVIDQV